MFSRQQQVLASLAIIERLFLGNFTLVSIIYLDGVARVVPNEVTCAVASSQRLCQRAILVATRRELDTAMTSDAIEV